MLLIRSPCECTDCKHTLVPHAATLQDSRPTAGASDQQRRQAAPRVLLMMPATQCIRMHACSRKSPTSTCRHIGWGKSCSQSSPQPAPGTWGRRLRRHTPRFVALQRSNPYQELSLSVKMVGGAHKVRGTCVLPGGTWVRKVGAWRAAGRGTCMRMQARCRGRQASKQRQEQQGSCSARAQGAQ